MQKLNASSVKAPFVFYAAAYHIPVIAGRTAQQINFSHSSGRNSFNCQISGSHPLFIQAFNKETS